MRFYDVCAYFGFGVMVGVGLAITAIAGWVFWVRYMLEPNDKPASNEQYMM